MSPKTSPKPKEKGLGLSAPVVSAADIAKAKEALQDDKIKKQEHSNMLFRLKKEGNKAAYEASPMQAKKNFLIGWFADKLSKGDVKSSSSKDIGSAKKTGMNTVGSASTILCIPWARRRRSFALRAARCRADQTR